MPVLRAVQLAVESELPKDIRDYNRRYNSANLDKILVDVFNKYPDQFASIQKRIADIGRNTTWARGDTVRLRDLAPVFNRDAMFAAMDNEMDEVKKLHANNPEAYKSARNQVLVKYSTLAEKLTMDTFGKNDNNVLNAVASGSRGKPAQVKAMLTTPGVYSDSKDRLIPVMIRRSYSDGLRPGEFMAGTFGARSAITSTKRATARGGEMLKLASAASINLPVTIKDCGTENGLMFKADDTKSLLFRTLAKPTAGFAAGTLIDRRVLTALKAANPDGGVIARSAISCQAEQGLCAKCAGAFSTGGKLPKIGEHIGVTAAQAQFEPVVQGSLGSKHTAGITTGKKTFSGLDALSQFLQSPENMEFRAAVADDAGEVTKIEDAEQGGKYVFVNDKSHYVRPGYEIFVKPGDQVEPGDQLGDGIVDARDVLRTRGLGEARRHYSRQLKQILDDSGQSASLQQTEILARGALDHMNIDDSDGVGGHLPDDVVSYNSVRSFYQPADEIEVEPVKLHTGKYLVKDALHFTAGTRLTPRMLGELKDAGNEKISVSAKPPGFSPVMSRLRTASHSQDDWLAVLGTNYLSRNMQDAVTRGADTNVQENVNYIPRLAIGEGFGKNIDSTGKF